MDSVQQANSGDPGTPMAMAPVAYALWQRVLRFDPEEPICPTATASCGRWARLDAAVHSLLYVTGVKAVDPDYERLGKLAVTLGDIKRFRSSIASVRGTLDLGHRDHHGTLGQGMATSVGMAKAVSRRRQT